jgi:hypothetical protein
MNSEMYGVERFNTYRETLGTFSSIAAAEKLIGSTLSFNTDKIDAFLSSRFGNVLVLDRSFDSATGFEGYKTSWKAQVEFRDTYNVRVIIDKNPSAYYGFNVRTAFPHNKTLLPNR